jgi:hypothetical protein
VILLSLLFGLPCQVGDMTIMAMDIQISLHYTACIVSCNCE